MSLFVTLLFVLLATASCNLFKGKEPELPVPLIEYIPDDWQLLDAERRGKLEFQGVNIDGDEETEWLLFFYYDNIGEDPETRGPVGGIIYDAQQDTEPYGLPVFEEQVIPFPYQPSAFLVPYRLLPDWRPDKGQGYLAETNVKWEEARVDKSNKGNDELIVIGYSPDDVPTRLSLFRWNGAPNGYGVAHFPGSYRVSTPGRKPGQPVEAVLTKDNLNERSHLCKQTEHVRQGNALNFSASDPTIVFCQSPTGKTAPEQPTYPEAVVLAWLITRNSELVLPDSQPQVTQLVPQSPKRVVNISYWGEAETADTQNEALSRVIVRTVIETDFGLLTYEWKVDEQRPKIVGESSRWRIAAVELVQ
ncbi:MAG: hypothetical protein U9R25_05900 [Chloroflexota bacterium]|nr:hypothetical protein [Chloroflexota bacterium]